MVIAVIIAIIIIIIIQLIKAITGTLRWGQRIKATLGPCR